MISAGTNIMSNMSMLKKVTVKHVFDSVRKPSPEIASHVNQLRIIRVLDDKQYNQLKRQLPYIVCSIFNPPYRKKENFAYTEYFIMDIDHVTSKQLSIYDIRVKIEKDPRVVLSFLSPGEDGLKVMFKMKERCYDSGLYPLFYKTFVTKFSQQYGLQQVVDLKTCDVTRACFISVDPDAYYNPNAEGIDMQLFIPMDNPFYLFELKHECEKTSDSYPVKTVEENPDPDKQAMNRIKELLNLKKKKEEKSVYVPQILNDIMDDLKQYVERTGVVLKEVINIQYGKKLRFTLGLKQAELNLFYGKRGFSVISSPRTGTDEELNTLMVDLISNYISEI